MNLNHLNLTVTNPLETQEFLAKYFGLKQMVKGNDHMAFLSDDNGMVLSLTSVKIGKESQVKYPATFHIGFGQETKERVNEINQRLAVKFGCDHHTTPKHAPGGVHSGIPIVRLSARSVLRTLDDARLRLLGAAARYRTARLYRVQAS